MKILIADDSALMRERLKETISIFGEVEIISEVETGIDALAEMEKLSPDLAILDVRMPEMSGLEVLKAFRKNNTTTRIMILTNYAYDQYRDRALESGADYFFSKSEDYDKILSVLASLLRSNSVKDKE